MGRLWLVVLAGCGRVDFDPVATRSADANLESLGDAGELTCTPYEAPTNLVFANSTGDDWEPTAAPNNGPIVFTTNRNTTNELWMTPRNATGTADVVAIDSLNSGVSQWGPQWNADGTRLYFSRDVGSNMGIGLFSATYANGIFGPAIAEQGFATDSVVQGIAVSRDELELFYGDSREGELAFLSRATRAAIGDPWTLQGHVDALNDVVGNSYATLSYDGNTLIFESDRDDATRGYWLTSTRASRDSPWSTPTIFEGVAHTTGKDGDPDLSSHDTVFAFSSTRAGGDTVHADLWLTTRTCN